MTSTTCPLCTEGISAYRHYAVTMITTFWRHASRRARSYYGEEQVVTHRMPESMFVRLFGGEEGDG